MQVRTVETDAALAELTSRIGGHVRMLRRGRGMSRRVLSDVSGVSERYLAQLETGNGNVTVGILHRLSLVFDCAVETLVAGGAGRGGAKAHRLALLGVRGGGKTTLGNAISTALAVPFIEISSQIEAISGMAVGEVISLYGQNGFRRYEEEAVASIIEDHDRVVIAAGGGVVEAGAAARHDRPLPGVVGAAGRGHGRARRAQLLALLTSLPAPCETSSDGIRRVGENGAEHIGKCVDALFNLVLAPDLSERDQYPIYIPILRGQLTNLQYQYLESPKTILLYILSHR